MHWNFGEANRMKFELWWASIGGNKCEPVRLMRDKTGKPKEWFSIGCADPHAVDDGMSLVQQIQDEQIPMTPKDAERQRRKWERERARMGVNATGYRLFDQ
jgi:hypothetical protein